MKTHSVCLPILAALALSVALARADSNNIPRGVSPSNAQLYVPDKSNSWSCLDGSKTIPFSAINDDYCDCADGSDEPGTSACGTGMYYCANIGHAPSSIKTSRVNDGVCDEECCDGSDEYDGQINCPNRCAEVGAKAREENERVQAIQNEGARLRKGFIKYGKANKASLNQELKDLKSQVDHVQDSLAQAKAKLDEVNAAQDAYLEDSKQEREAARKQQLTPIIQEQTKRFKYATEVRDMLERILKDLKDNHNKNYHDLAVKDTVSGFDEYTATLPNEKTDKNESVSPDRQYEDLLEETSLVLRDIGTLYDLLDGMKRDYNTEYNDEAVLAAVKVTENFEITWDYNRSDFVGIEPLVLPEEEVAHNPEAEKYKKEVDAAQEAFNEASGKESKIQDRIRDIERKLSMDFGPDETFASLVDNCFDFKDVDKFSGWEGKNYDVQMYTGGTKCWNGPERSVKLVMTCGTTTEILSVTEPEKCEYLYKLQTPAVCPIPEGDIEDEIEAKEQLPEQQQQQQDETREENVDDVDSNRRRDEL
ncbi:hypothetical protein FBU30_002294 [Linnemannia zychae]|nr:hypothetical protein FBU30_002294 [Linnemannia zychae]